MPSWLIWPGTRVNDRPGQEAMYEEGFTLQAYPKGCHHRGRFVMAIKEVPEANDIITVLETVFGINRTVMLSECFRREVSQPRNAGMWACREIGWQWKRIADTFRRDHSTCIKNVNRCEQLQARDSKYKRKCQSVLELIK